MGFYFCFVEVVLINEWSFKINCYVIIVVVVLWVLDMLLFGNFLWVEDVYVFIYVFCIY